MLDYPPEQLKKLYEKLPEKLKEAVFSKAIADNIADISEQNNLEKEKSLKLTKYVGYVFLGILPPNELEGILIKDLAINNDSAKKISDEIKQIVFSPLKESLETLYGSFNIPESSPKPAPFVKKGKLDKDTYREPLE